MTVYETDQWTSVQVDRQGLTLEQLKASKGEVYGGDADSVRKIFGGGKVVQKEVNDQASPFIGRVWFVEVEGKLEVYKANYDSSD